MSIFYSHSEKIDNKKIGTKLLKVHLDGVANHAIESFCKQCNLSFSNDRLSDLLKDVAYLHDLGKYMSYFQNYLLGIQPIDYDLKQHPQIGAIAVYNQWLGKDKTLALVAYTLVISHHLDLENIIDSSYLSPSNGKAIDQILEKQIVDLNKSLKIIQDEIGFLPPIGQLTVKQKNDVKNKLEDLQEEDADINHYFLINYLFSLLIESDKLDASQTIPYIKSNLPKHAVEEKIGCAAIVQASLSDMTQNQVRNYVRFQVTSALNEPFILNQKLFTLTAPTGIGKTYTALDFAIKLRSKIFEAEGIEAQIICALPFINIIEQTLAVYENDVFKGRAKVLAHYQFADIFGQAEKYSENKEYNQKKMQTDTWQADVVITSFVQFLETLIGNRNKLLKKFHHFANAIIILDEVQTIRLDYLPLVGAMLYYLSVKLNSRILLMTATKPQIFELANRELLKNEKVESKALELLPNYAEVFQLFKRTKIVPLIEEKLDDEMSFLKLVELHWQPSKSCLIVCNKVNRSIEVYKQIKEMLKERNCKNPLFYLSTNITPVQRMETILKIKKRIKRDKNRNYLKLGLHSKKHSKISINNKGECGRMRFKPLLISTQVVEAGVDLDFDMGFRDLGPIDSIVQVAGRINREGKKGEFAPLYIVDFGDCKKIYGDITDQQAKKALNSFEGEIIEPKYEQMVNHYFNQLSNVKSFSKSKSFFKSVKELNYSNGDEAIGKFRLIEETNTTSAVFIELNENAREIKEAYRSFSDGEMKVEDFERDFKRSFHQHIVAVPSYVVKQTSVVHNKLSDSIFYVELYELENYYDMETGFKRKDSKDVSAIFF